MRVEAAQCKCFTIWDAPKLDPITVHVQDTGPGAGQLVVSCFGEAWSAYWGAMGSRTVLQFVAEMDADYLTERLWPGRMSRTKHLVAYLRRIVDAVKAAAVTQLQGTA